MPEDFDTEPADLDAIRSPPADDGLSLDELSDSFAQLLGKGRDPYSDAATNEGDPELGDPETDEDPPAEEDECPVTPLSIVEAILFVGHPENEPLTSRQIASLMRGVRAVEIDEFVGELNASYEELGSVYQIESVGAGYRMSLRPEFEPVRETFYGKVREARLTQLAIDVLSVVGYHQPISRGEVDEMCQRPCGSVLNQLVRRQLLEIERHDDKPRTVEYRTTDRFLELFHLESLEDLPRSQEPDA